MLRALKEIIVNKNEGVAEELTTEVEQLDDCDGGLGRREGEGGGEEEEEKWEGVGEKAEDANGRRTEGGRMAAETRESKRLRRGGGNGRVGRRADLLGG